MDYLSISEFQIELKKLMCKIEKNNIPTASEEMIKIAIEAREEIDSNEGFEFEFETGAESTFTSVTKRKKLRTLEKIREMIRNSLPPDGLVEGEVAMMPFSEQFEGFTEHNVLHVDSFLYPNDEIIDEYCERGLLSRTYCSKCGSKETKELNYISHSISDVQADFVFSHVLTEDLSTKCIIDVGSRIGVILYYGWLFTDSVNIIGIEFNKYFVDLQQKILKKFKMNQRVNVICADVKDKSEILRSGDVIILNNVFEAFIEKSLQKDIWKFVFTNLKSGATVITIPSIEQSLISIEAKDIDWKNYLIEEKIEIPPNIEDDDKFEIEALHCYTVK